MPHPIDIHVGRKIREARVLRGLTQAALAEKIGASFHQLQKYESAQNRVSCSRLYAIAVALDVPVQSFFVGSGDPEREAQRLTRDGFPNDTWLNLTTVYSRLRPDLRRKILDTAKSLATITEERQ